MKKVLLVLSSILLSSSLFAQENNTFVEEKVDINAIKNQIFFKVEGSKAYIMSPVSYLNDNDRRKTDAIEYINDLSSSLQDPPRYPPCQMLDRTYRLEEIFVVLSNAFFA